MNPISQETVQKILQNLTRNEMEALFFPTAAAAKAEVLERIPPQARVGVGGSVTVRQMSLLQALQERGNEVYDHWKEGLSPKERFETAKRQQGADFFLTSSNALTLDGKLINIDATGNRVASMFFGPPRVIAVIGVNKIVKNLNEGLARLKKTAAPQNARRRKDPTPCAADLICRNCDMPARTCRVTTIIEKKPWGVKELTVMLVGEELGY